MKKMILAAVAGLAVSGCAMKSDIRMLQHDMLSMQQHQDSVLRDLQRQNRLLLDSLRATMALTVDTRGATTNQLRQVDQNLARFGELAGQILGTLSRIESRVTALEQRPAATPVSGGGSPGGGTAEEYYTTGMEMMQQGSYATARMAFQQLVQEFPSHDRAPDAQFQIGQAFYHEGQFQEAYAALELVPAQWPTSPRASAALFRAGAIAEERRGFVKARGYYQQIVDKYGRSEEAAQARQKLRTLPR